MPETLFFRHGQKPFHEAGRLSSPQQVDEREYLRFLRQNGWTVRKSAVLKASFPLTYAECEIGGVIRCHFENTRKPVGLGGKIMVAMMNLGHSPVARWGLRFLELTPDAKVLDCGCGGGGEHQETSEKNARRGIVKGVDYSPSVWRNQKRSTSRHSGGTLRCSARQRGGYDVC